MNFIGYLNLYEGRPHMKTEEIIIRDPYVLLHEDKYYLYGTRSKSCWGEMDGFDCYVSADLDNWEGPFEIFRKEENFWADQSYWAPECYHKEGSFYLVATLGAENRKKSVNLLKADSPLGPFHYCSQLTSSDRECIDGTIYEEDGYGYLVYSNTLQDTITGDMCAIQLSDDWESTIGDPFKLFAANDAKWALPVPFAKSEFGIDGEAYFSDGPSLFKAKNSNLVMLWSSWAGKGYSVGVAYSESGKIQGPWKHESKLLIENGGHGMIFQKMDGTWNFSLHYPNDRYNEHPLFISISDGELPLEV